MHLQLLSLFLAASLALAQQGGIVVQVPVERKAAEMTDEELLRGELAGTVTVAAGRDVTLNVHGPFVPRVGDRVELFRVTKGYATPVGTGTVTYAEGDVVKAMIDDAGQSPPPGTVAIIHSAIPSGTISTVGFENRGRPTESVENMVAKSGRKLDLETKAKKSFEEARRLLAASPPDVRRAVELLRSAAEINHVQAAWWLYQLSKRGQPGVPDETEAARWLRRAAELGDANAQRSLGELLAAQDSEKGHAWARKAASQRRPEAVERAKPSTALPR